MPIVSVGEAALFEGLERKYTDDEFDKLCFRYGLELDEITTEADLAARERGKTESAPGYSPKIYKVEVPANRYDLLCTEGLVKALRIFLEEIPIPCFKKSDVSKYSINVKQNVKCVRPYVVAAVLRKVTLSDDRLQSLINLQEKLHQNLCRKRSLVAIGIHNLDSLKPPFIYDALEPSKIKFQPLNQSQQFTAEQMMELYSTDTHLKQYLPLVKDKPKYPVITDSNGVVLSMPPIINGEHSRVSATSRNLFIEATATDLHKACIVLDTLVTALSEYCEEQYTVEPVEVIQSDGSRRVYPLLEYRTEMVSSDYANQLLGTKLTSSEMAKLLNRMGLAASPATDSSNLVSVRIPPTRHDILHACDIVEDVAIAFDYDAIEESLPQTYCIASSQPVNRLTHALRAEIAQAGFTEVLSFSLCSLDDVSTKLRRQLSDVPAVRIGNPKTSDFQVVRTSLLPGILHTLANNRSLSLPLKAFEVQDVVVKDVTADVGARNHRRICAVYCNKSSGFEIIHGLLDRLMQLLQVEWHGSTNTEAGDGKKQQKAAKPTSLTYELRASEDPTYLDKRCADVVLHPSGKSVGRLGVLHPEVLANFDLAMPCSALDLDLEAFL